MKTENLSTLKIHKISQEQYNREYEAGRIDPTAIYLTPENGSDSNCNVDLAGYDWSGKKIVFEGDSITTNGTPAYPEYVKEQTGCIPVNIGQAGHPILWPYPGEAWDYRQRLSNIPADADAIIIMGDYLGAPR